MIRSSIGEEGLPVFPETARTTGRRTHLGKIKSAGLGSFTSVSTAVVYDLLFKAAAAALLTLAADPKHLGARIGLTAVLHTWGSALTHHPHAHVIVPGGGIALDGSRWIASRPGFLLPVRVLSRLFRRLFLDGLSRAQAAGRLGFFGAQAHLAEPEAFSAFLAALRRIEWVVYCKRPFSGPEAVLAYLARYTHRVAISNSRLIACDADGIRFRWKDYRAKERQRSKVMRLSVDEFIRRFLLHVLPDGFHRIRHYGLFGNGVRQANLARARTLLAAADKPMADAPAPDAPIEPSRCCPCCGGRMILIERFARGCAPRSAPSHPIRIDTS